MDARYPRVRRLSCGTTPRSLRPTLASETMAADDCTPVLRVENLEVRYGAVVAATEISLFVNRGEVVALLGPNGAGKTSVLKSIMGLVPATAGTIDYFDDAS